MQTFLPIDDFIATAKCLDYRRLGKQRVEAMQIVNIIDGNVKSNAWKNHPAIGLWKDNLDCLKLYYNCIVKEWISRGYRNNMKFYRVPDSSTIKFPTWFGRFDFHSRHRAALLAKDITWYSQFGWSEDPKIDYIWK